MTTTTATCASCRFSRPLRGDRKKLEKRLFDAQHDLAQMKVLRANAKWWNIFAPNDDDIWFAERTVENHEHRLKQFDEGLVCQRHPSLVDKKRNDTCGEYARHTGVRSRWLA